MSESELERRKAATIVMVDDEPITTEVIQTFLDDDGYSNFVTTDQSTEALELIQKHRPDVVLLDLMMPEVSGFDILTAMRADDELKHIPAIVLTSATDGDTKLKALELGATDFLAKPVDPSELALRLRNTLAAKAYRDQLDYRDAVTGLPSRRMFLDLVRWALKRAERRATIAAVLHVDLERSQRIDDALGHKTKEALLKTLAERLQRCIRASDAVGRLGEHAASSGTSSFFGDRFAVLLPEISDVENAAAVARRILGSFANPTRVDDQEFSVTPSIGIAFYPDDGERTEDLLERARLATHRAKQSGESTYWFCSEEINTRATERSRFDNDLPLALTRDELVLHYQPKVNTMTHRVPGVEALLRWNHPELGMVLPDEFLPPAQETGLIVPIGEWVLHEACKQTKVWHSAGLSTMTVSVNVAAQQLRENRLTQTVREALESSGLEPHYLTLELTESAMMEHAQQEFDVLRDVKAMGVKISIDDFGTGQSSLSFLKRLPVDELKIDRCFFTGGGMSAGDAAMVTAIIAAAHGLGLSVVAKGIESKQQLEFLRRKGCDHCQGFLFCKPCSADAISTRIGRPKQDSVKAPATVP